MSTQKEVDIVQKGIDLSWMTWGKMRDSTLVTGEVCYIKSETNNGPERIFKVNFNEENVDYKIWQMISYIKAGIMPDSILLMPNTMPSNLADILSKRGFDLNDSDPCMLLDLKKYSYVASQGIEITVKQIATTDELKPWVSIVNTELFGCELFTFEQFCDVLALDNTCFYIGLWNGMPATACLTITDGQTSVLEMVATRSDYRCRGLALAVIDKAISDLISKNIETISLRAEPDGVSVYKRLGFYECFKRTVASCNWERVYREACPCKMEKERILFAQQIWNNTKNVKAFVYELDKQHVIGKTISYNEAENTIYITKMYACDCGGGCRENNTLIGQRCHCEYINHITNNVPMSYCKCAATFFEPLFNTLFGANIQIEPVKTVLSGSEECVFKITL